MRITDEMVTAFHEAASGPHGSAWAGLEAVAPLIRAAYAQELLDNAWSGSARGAIRGAMEMAERVGAHRADD